MQGMRPVSGHQISMMDIDMDYGRFQIKNVKHSVAKSYETQHFSLDLWADGVKLAEVFGNGDDGVLEVSACEPSTWDDINKYEAIMASDEFLTDTFIDPFDTSIRTLVDVWRKFEEIKRKTATKVVFIDGDRLLTFGNAGSKRAPSDYQIQRIATANPSAVILNGMDTVEAAILAVKADRAAQAKIDAEEDGDYTPPSNGM